VRLPTLTANTEYEYYVQITPQEVAHPFLGYSYLPAVCLNPTFSLTVKKMVIHTKHVLKDSNLICETGTNSPALRSEFKDLYLQGERPATSQAAKISDEE
jgi:hypothetical protein